MRKAFEASIAASVAITCVEAGRHPFVGEHRNSSIYDHGNGNVSMKMTAKAAPFNKYEKLLVKEGLFQNRKSPLTRLGDYLWGKPEEPVVKANKYGYKRLGQSIEHELINTSGTMWTGQILMGGVKNLDVVYDTGSDWLVIESSDCSNCEGDTYDITTSSGSPQRVATTLSERNYGSASLEGYEWTDKVCLLPGVCLDTFEFFMFQKQSGISEPIDGILGLSRNAPFVIKGDNQNTSGPLFVENLATAGLIAEDKFSFYFQSPASASYMDLGTPDVELHKKEGATLLTTQLLENDFFWSDYNAGVAFGTIDNAYAYESTPEYPGLIEGNTLYSIIDTGSTALVICALYYESFIVELFKAAQIDDWVYEQGAVFTKCSYTLPSVFFLLDGHWVEARAQDYLFDYAGDGNMCLLFIMPVNSPMSILGMPLFVDYYSVHDPVQGSVGWVPHNNSVKGDIVPGTAPTGKFLTIGGEAESPTQQLIKLLVLAGLCFGSIYFWQTSLHAEIVKQTDNRNYQLLASGGYFLIAAMTIFLVLQPIVVDEVLSSFVTTTSSRNNAFVKSSAGNGYLLPAVCVAGAAFLFKMLLTDRSQAQTKKTNSGKSIDHLLKQVNEQLEAEPTTASQLI